MTRRGMRAGSHIRRLHLRTDARSLLCITCCSTRCLTTTLPSGPQRLFFGHAYHQQPKGIGHGQSHRRKHCGGFVLRSHIDAGSHNGVFGHGSISSVWATVKLRSHEMSYSNHFVAREWPWKCPETIGTSISFKMKQLRDRYAVSPHNLTLEQSDRERRAQQRPDGIYPKILPVPRYQRWPKAAGRICAST